MLFNHVAFTLFAASAAAVAEKANDEAFAGYLIEILEWEFPSPNGGFVYVNGTAEQAVNQLREIFPDVNPYKDLADIVNAGGLNKRTDFTGAGFHCGFKEYGDCFKVGIVQGIQYLRSLSGRPKNGPGPGACGRVSCGYGNAIYWCNDERTEKTLEGWHSIADGAQFLLNHCAEGGPGQAYVHGQVFHRTNWNVIVRHASC